MVPTMDGTVCQCTETMKILYRQLNAGVQLAVATDALVILRAKVVEARCENDDNL